jgi:6-pyruvoyltetrahydropterin/6-carboxytetrahydropterin synthase
MGQYELAITGHFASAHSLRGYQGPCEEIHGHTWKVEITLISQETNTIGLVVDFRDMKDKLEKFLSQLDHGYLNNLPAFQKDNPSTENLAKFIYQGFSPLCLPHKLQKVRVWESDSASVTYYEK